MHESDCEWCWLCVVERMEPKFSVLTFQHFFLVQSKIIFLPFPVPLQSTLRILTAFLFHCATLSTRLQNPAGACTEIHIESCPGLTLYKASHSMFQDINLIIIPLPLQEYNVETAAVYSSIVEIDVIRLYLEDRGQILWKCNTLPCKGEGSVCVQRKNKVWIQGKIIWMVFWAKVPEGRRTYFREADWAKNPGKENPCSKAVKKALSSSSETTLLSCISLHELTWPQAIVSYVSGISW